MFLHLHLVLEESVAVLTLTGPVVREELGLCGWRTVWRSDGRRKVGTVPQFVEREDCIT